MQYGCEMSTSSDIWLLLDDRPGTRSQVIGVGDALSKPYSQKDIGYNRLSYLPYWLARMVSGMNIPIEDALKWVGVDVARSSPLGPPWPKVVISAGRRSSRVAALIKRKSMEETAEKSSSFVVQIMKPDTGFRDIDLLSIPAQDNAWFTWNRHSRLTVLRPKLAPHAVSKQKLEEAATTWSPRLAHLPHPRIAVLVGGGARQIHFGAADFMRLAEMLDHARNEFSASLMITTSRRTTADGRLLLSQIITPQDIFYDWGVWQGKENPFMGFLALADIIVVTGDSISMPSEAISTGKPVYIFTPKKLPPKVRRFLQALYDENLARPLTGDMDKEWRPAPSQGAAMEIARHIPL